MTAKSKAQLMRETRARRKHQGLISFREWVTPDESEKLKKALEKMRKAQ